MLKLIRNYKEQALKSYKISLWLAVVFCLIFLSIFSILFVIFLPKSALISSIVTVLLFGTVIFLFLNRNNLPFIELNFLKDIQNISMSLQNFRREDEKLKSILNSIGAGLVALNKDLEIIWNNNIFSEWFKVENHSHCFESMDNNGYCEICPTKKAFATGIVHTANQVRTTKKGEKHFKVISVPWKNERNEVTQVFELLLDISDRALLENKLRSIESEAVIGKLAASMAHEIRNPLSSIVSSINLLHKNMDNGLSSDDRRKLIDVVNEESHRLSTLLEDFLKYGRKKKTKIELCDISEVLDEIIDIARYRKDVQNRVSFSKKIKGPIPMIYVDKEMLKQVFWNLIINSMDAIQKSGSININIEGKGDFVEVLLSDTGVGIPGHIMKNIFEPFHTTKKGGTGLGLAIAKKMIGIHSGTIELLESSEAGTTFLTRLPVSSKESAVNYG